VDDCHDSADGMSWILSTYGYKVEVAYDGNAAILKARAHAPDIVLLDLALPEMDGYQVADAMRSEAGSGAPVFVAITGYGREDDKRQSAAAGFKHHLTKPIDPLALLETLANV
jgi:CheY-like chemotaxis protein